MRFKSNITYYDGFGKIVSKEEYERAYEKFISEVELAYNNKANEIIEKINNKAINDIEKIWMLFDYFTSDSMHYKMNGTTQDGKSALDVNYDFPPYTFWKISHRTKYPALLNNSGVCQTYSLAFEDLSNRLGIPCRVVIGSTSMGHAWNVVYINDTVKYIDIAYALMNKDRCDKRNYFLKNASDFTSRTIDSNISDLINDMKIQYSNLHPDFKVTKRTDIKVINRTDENISNKKRR